MQRDTGRRAFEKSRLFPYLAWGLILGFAYFVYDLSTKLQAVVHDLPTTTPGDHAPPPANSS